jgi:hypothetical protein
MMSRVGHAFIKQQMRANNAIFAGELSGHYYFRDNYTTESSAMSKPRSLRRRTRASRACLSPRLIDLVRNFSRIEDERVRTHLMALVRSLAGRGEEDEDALASGGNDTNADDRRLMG